MPWLGQVPRWCWCYDQEKARTSNFKSSPAPLSFQVVSSTGRSSVDFRASKTTLIYSQNLMALKLGLFFMERVPAFKNFSESQDLTLLNLSLGSLENWSSSWFLKCIWIHQQLLLRIQVTSILCESMHINLTYLGYTQSNDKMTNLSSNHKLLFSNGPKSIRSEFSLCWLVLLLFLLFLQVTGVCNII